MPFWGTVSETFLAGQINNGRFEFRGFYSKAFFFEGDCGVDNAHDISHEHMLGFDCIADDSLIFFSKKFIYALLIEVIGGIFDLAEAEEMAIFCDFL